MSRSLLLTFTIALVISWGSPAFSQDNTLAYAGPFDLLASATVPATGATLTVARPGHALNGLTAKIEGGSFGEPRPVTISAASIATHSFGPQLNALTPMIRFDCGTGFASETIELRVPVHLGTAPFARGLAYDEATRSLRDLAVTRIASGVIAVPLARTTTFVLSGPPQNR